MRKVRCVRGHFYDADMNALCPHCGSPEGKEEKKEVTVEEVEAVSGTKSKKGHGLFFGKKANKKSKEENDLNDVPTSSTKKEEEVGKSKETPIKPEVDEKKTHSFWTKEKSFWEEEAGTKEPIEEDPEVVVPKPKAAPRDIDSVKTVSKYVSEGGVEPVTGWLVCIKGTNYGKAFEIKAGQNSIGRSSDMSICIKEEDITKERHAFIIFEPKKRQFFLRGGDGSGLTYRNEEMVTGMMPLNAYDKVQLGDAEFLFIPFCGEQFMWEEK